MVKNVLVPVCSVTLTSNVRLILADDTDFRLKSSS